MELTTLPRALLTLPFPKMVLLQSVPNVNGAHLEYMRKTCHHLEPEISETWNSSKACEICQGREHVRGLESTEFGVHVEQRIGNVCLVTLLKVFDVCRRILEAPREPPLV